MPASDHKRRLTAFVVAMAVLIATPLAVVATDAFTDVPDGNVHHENITWLANAGITSGCNPPDNDEYCPSDSVTRAQMATFMRNLAENQVVDAATAIEAENANTLEGEGPGAYRSVGSADLDSDLSGPNVSEETELNSLTLTAPEDGVIVVSGSAYLTNQTGANAFLGLRPAVDGALVTGAGGNAAFDSLADGESDSLGYTVAFEVSAGTHTVVQTASVVSGAGAPIAGAFFYNANQLTAEWHPEGSVTLATAGGTSEGEIGG